MAKNQTEHRPLIEKCRRELARVSALLEQRDYEQARAVCVAVLGDLDEHGLASCTTFRLYAVILDNLGLVREALAAAERALDGDPLYQDATRSREIIVQRLRESILADLAKENADEAMRRYEALRERGEATVEVHVAAARLHVAAGSRQGARKILAAVVTLHPGAVEAWRLLEELGCADDSVQVMEQVEVISTLRAPAGVA